MGARPCARTGGFRARVLGMAGALRPEYPAAQHVEDRLYEGEFFPLAGDVDLLPAFHASNPAEKPTLLAALQDDRAQQLGRRIVYNEWPETLSAAQRVKMERGRRDRRHTVDDVPWTSIPKAMAEIDELLPTAPPPTAKLLEEYGRYLRAEAA